MKKRCFLVLLLNVSYLTSCVIITQPTDQTVKHNDPFYNINHDDYPLLHLPLIKPIEVKRFDGRTPWRIFLFDGPNIKLSNRHDIVYYGYNIEELEKFTVSNGIILAYSPYVDEDADPFVVENYYHWFVVIPDRKISEGFHTEDEFDQYILSLGIEEIDWKTPDEAYQQFRRTGCLEWIPDCN